MVKGGINTPPAKSIYFNRIGAAIGPSLSCRAGWIDSVKPDNPVAGLLLFKGLCANTPDFTVRYFRKEELGLESPYEKIDCGGFVPFYPAFPAGC